MTPLLIEPDGIKIQQLWSQYFPDVSLTDLRYFRYCDSALLAKALAITSKKDKHGRFPIRTQDHIGKYVNGVIRELKRQANAKPSAPNLVMEIKITVQGGYEISENDKQRFKSKLVSSGDCLLFNGSKHAGGYGRFHVNGALIGAHRFAFFAELGCLPASGEMKGFEIAHLCKARSCCNPSHLNLTSKKVNLAQRRYDRAMTERDGFIAVNSLPPVNDSLPSLQLVSTSLDIDTDAPKVILVPCATIVNDQAFEVLRGRTHPGNCLDDYLGDRVSRMPDSRNTIQCTQSNSHGGRLDEIGPP